MLCGGGLPGGEGGVFVYISDHHDFWGDGQRLQNNLLYGNSSSGVEIER